MPLLLQILNAALWYALTLGAVLAWRRAPADERATWLVIAAACAVAALDKTIDVQGRAYVWAQQAADVIAPLIDVRRHKNAMKVTLLGLAFAIAVAVIAFVTTFDRHLDRPKLVAITGLVLLAGYVAARLAPPFGPYLRGAVSGLIEASCAGLVAWGLWLELRSRPATAAPRR